MERLRVESLGEGDDLGLRHGVLARHELLPHREVFKVQNRAFVGLGHCARFTSASSGTRRCRVWRPRA